jgi:lipopolysaccharide/colanic/teichoic acid biosynthesis glycosyltransferase
VPSNQAIGDRSPARGYTFAKRAFDITAAAICLVLALPISAAVTVAVLLDDGAPVLYRGLRVGRHGRLFRILKFRTMVKSADRIGRHITVADDPRVTRVGHLLRSTKLDEIPQLVNVFVGSMSLVGPRPEDPMYVRDYTAEQRRVLDVRPGITSVASLYYRNEEALLTASNIDGQYEAILADKIRLDLKYLDQCTFWSDLRLILATVMRLPAQLR